ncbi:GNAT family N-acyltransferase [Pseudogemmobacter sonorensis]|uniref:GNAT family N-acyltransferase n=1 Tax=Pseudogemmobacter sonorensis TaxID=2989681 RepID=UPI0036BFC601
MIGVIEAGGMRARLAGAGDRAGLLAMRARAFPHARGRGEGRAPEWEALDDRCLQLLVEDARDARPLLSCRILPLASGRALEESYSARFYDLSPLGRESRAMVEIGRFCLAPGGEGFQALRLGWVAVTRIVARSGAGLLLGCSSFRGTDWRAHRPALAHLARHALGPEGLRPLPRAPERVDFPALVGAPEPPPKPTAELTLPPLLRFYLGMGAWVGDHAVIDSDLETLHVFTCLEVAGVPGARAARLRGPAGL